MTMTIARVSRDGRSEDLQSLETGAENHRRGEDEFKSDADHKELTSAYSSDDYLLKWLPNITNHKQVSTSKPSHCEERMERKDQIEAVSFDTFFKPASPNRQTKEADPYISSGNKVFRETKTYFEAIKCSPMKLQQSIAAQKHNKVSGKSLIIRKHPQNPVEERVHTNQARSSVVETTSDPAVRQLGSLSFQTKNTERCPQSELPYRTCHLVGGKMSKTRRNIHKKVARNSDELRVRCESVMIYAKSLVSSGNEKPKLTKPRKEAWRETSLALKNEEDYTKLPELGVKTSGRLRQDGKFSPELEENSKGKQEKPQANLQCTQSRSASTKIIIPFAGDEELLQHTIDGKRPTVALKQEEIKVLEPSQTSKVHHDQNSKKKREYFYDNQEAWRPYSPGKSKRRVTSMVITQLGTPRKTIYQPSTTAATPSVPFTKTRIGTADVNGLFLGRKNLPRQRAGARFSYNQRKRVDLGIKNKERLQIERSDHEVGGKCLTENTLTVGGTRLLREQRGLHENFGEGEEIEEQRGHFRNSLPHSHYIT